MREELFQVAHENAGLDAIHSQGHTQQFKIGLPLTLAKLPQQNSLEITRTVIRLVAGIDCIQTVPEDLFGQVGEGIAINNLLRSIPAAANCASMR